MSVNGMEDECKHRCCYSHYWKASSNSRGMKGRLPPVRKLSMVAMKYARLISKHPSNDGRSATPGLGTPHTPSNSTLQRATRDLQQNIRATTQGQPHRGWVPPHSGGQTQHCSVLRAAYLKTSEQRRRSSTPGLGTPHTRSNSTL